MGNTTLGSDRVLSSRVYRASLTSRPPRNGLSWQHDLRNTLQAQTVLQNGSMRSAGADAYDGIRYEELPIETVDWEHRADHISKRSTRKNPNEFDVKPEWATEAAHDRYHQLRDSGSETGQSIEVVGYSEGAGRVLTVTLVPKDHPPTGEWWGATAFAADDADARKYQRQREQRKQRENENEREHQGHTGEGG